jgi:hypothetical protein
MRCQSAGNAGGKVQGAHQGGADPYGGQRRHVEMENRISPQTHYAHVDRHHEWLPPK